MRVAGLFREFDLKHDYTRGPSLKNPGGGIATKIDQLRRALPSVYLTSDVSELTDVNICESLWFSGVDNLSEEVFAQRVDAYRDQEGYKILWTSDVEFLRWRGCEREAIFDASDVVAGNSEYMCNLLSAYCDKVEYLTDPFDVAAVDVGKERTRSIYANSQVIIEKGIDKVIETFAGLKGSDVYRIFIGSPSTWGLELNPVTTRMLDARLSRVCDKRMKSATKDEVYSVASSAWMSLFFAKFESFGYAMIEALAGGGWVFCGGHLVYKDRPVFWCDSVADAIEKIKAFMAEFSLEDVNHEGREFVAERYGLPVFRGQLRSIVGGAIGV